MDPVTYVGNLIAAHPYVTLGVLVAYWLLSNIVAALPSPDQSSGGGYKFLFTFGHSLVGSIPRILPSLRLPGDPSRNTPTYFGKPPDTGAGASSENVTK